MSSTAIETITITDANVDDAKASADESLSKSSSVVSGWLNRLDQIDEMVSTPVFRLGLPKWVELVFSVPACFFGMSFTPFVGPLWIAILALSAAQQQQQQLESQFQQDNEIFSNANKSHKIFLLQAIAVSITFIYVAAWGGFQVFGWQKPMLQLFWNWKLYVLASPWNACVLAYTVLGLNDVNHHPNDNDKLLLSPNTKAIVSMSLYPLTLLPFIFLLLGQLKERSRRSRPAKKDKERQPSVWTQQKRFPAMIHMLAEQDGHRSFPSGNVTCAALLVIPIYHIDGDGCWDLFRSLSSPPSAS